MFSKGARSPHEAEHVHGVGGAYPLAVPERYLIGIPPVFSRELRVGFWGSHWPLPRGRDGRESCFFVPTRFRAGSARGVPYLSVHVYFS